MNTNKRPDAAPLPLMQALDIWSAARLPDLQMQVPPGSPPEPAKVDPPVTAPALSPSSMDDEDLARLPVQAQSYIKELRGEAKTRRIENSTLKEQQRELKERLDRIETERRTAEEAELAKKEEWKTLHDRKDAEYRELTTRAQQSSIEAAIKLHAVDDGIKNNSDRMNAALKLIDRTGISVDAQGNVTGVKEALERAKAEYPSFFVVPPAGNNGGQSDPPQPGSGTDPQGGAKPNPADNMLVPGTNVTYAQVEEMKRQSRMGGGRDPNPSGGQGAPAKVDVRSMTKEQALAWEREFMSKLPRNDGARTG